MCKLVADLEYLIGSECYNPNSYDGWNDIEGCDYRYPISVPDANGEYTKIKRNINSSSLINTEDINDKTIPFIKYKFGSNELYIGRGLFKVLEYLEKRYSIDFIKMEREIKKED